VKVLVPLASGFEEMEAVIIVDVLRRAQWEVVTAAVRGNENSAGGHCAAITGSRGIRVEPDAEWKELDPAAFGALVLPGGSGGVDNLRGDQRILTTLRDFSETDKWIGAICAAPLVLQAAGILNGVRATCHPAVRDNLTAAKFVDQPVVLDQRIVTSQGPGTAIPFALTLIALVSGKKAADAIARQLVFSSFAA